MAPGSHFSYAPQELPVTEVGSCPESWLLLPPQFSGSLCILGSLVGPREGKMQGETGEARLGQEHLQVLAEEMS